MAHDFFNNNPSYNFKVVGGIISPVSDGYGKSSLISASHRLEMCRLACENHPFIGVESWEALNSEWTPTLTAVKYYDEEIKRDSDCSKVKLMLLIGSDLVDGFRDAHIWNEDGLKELISSFGLVIIERNPHNEIPIPSEIFESDLLYSLRDNIFFVPQMVTSELSSSKLRLLIRRGHSIKYLTSDKVIDYIKNNGLYN